MEPRINSHNSSSEIRRPRNSSGMMVKLAAAALPMPSARWPAARPMLTMRYQREVVRASSAMLRTIWTPSWRGGSQAHDGGGAGGGGGGWVGVGAGGGGEGAAPLPGAPPGGGA